MKHTCTRPEWSNESNDCCPCDDLSYFDHVINDCNEDPCEECSWYKEVEE